MINFKETDFMREIGVTQEKLQQIQEELNKLTGESVTTLSGYKFVVKPIAYYSLDFVNFTKHFTNILVHIFSLSELQKLFKEPIKMIAEDGKEVEEDQLDLDILFSADGLIKKIPEMTGKCANSVNHILYIALGDDLFYLTLKEIPKVLAIVIKQNIDDEAKKNWKEMLGMLYSA